MAHQKSSVAHKRAGGPPVGNHCYMGLNKDKLPKREVKFMTITLDEKKSFLVSRIKGKKAEQRVTNVENFSLPITKAA